VQANRLKHKYQQPQGLRLPSLEWLERLNTRALVVSVAMFAIGLLSGVVLNLYSKRQQLDELPWNDPIIWSSGIVLVWLIAAASFATFYRPARQGKKVAYLTVASFVFLAATIAIRLMLPSQHAPTKAVERATSPWVVSVEISSAGRSP
jgi:hypothetical protein